MFHPHGPTLRELVAQALSSTQRGYDLIAPKFERTPFRTPDHILDKLVGCLQSGPEIGAALDIGCGTGAALRKLRPWCRQRIVGIDFSPGMLAEARRLGAGAPGTADVELVLGDFLEMPFEAEFDLAVCFGALGHILPGDQVRFVHRVAKALKPGGRFVFVTSPQPALHTIRYWMARTFNLAMHLRNLVKSPPFIMFYLTFPTSRATELLSTEGFTCDIRRGLFTGRYSALELVIATWPHGT